VPGYLGARQLRTPPEKAWRVLTARLVCVEGLRAPASRGGCLGLHLTRGRRRAEVSAVVAASEDTSADVQLPRAPLERARAIAPPRRPHQRQGRLPSSSARRA
jgi:hypothetical protein